MRVGIHPPATVVHIYIKEPRISTSAAEMTFFSFPGHRNSWIRTFFSLDLPNGFEWVSTNLVLLRSSNVKHVFPHNSGSLNLPYPTQKENPRSRK
jgi:hypothetical protein